MSISRSSLDQIDLETAISNSSQQIHAEAEPSHHIEQRSETRKPAVRIIEPPSSDSDSSSRAGHNHLEVVERITSSGHGPDENGDQVQPLRSTFRKWLKRSATPHHRRRASEQNATQQSAHDTTDTMSESSPPDVNQHPESSPYAEEAAHIARTFTQRNLGITYDTAQYEPQGQVVEKYSSDVDYVPPPKEYKPSVFGALLASKLTNLERQNVQQRSLYQNTNSSRMSLSNIQPHKHKRARSDNMQGVASGTTTPKDTNWYDKSEHSALAGMLVHSATSSPDRSGATTPKKIKWYDKPEHSALASMLVHSALPLASPGLPETTRATFKTRSRGPSRRASMEKTQSYFDMEKAAIGPRSRRGSHSSQETLINELRDILACRNYLIKLCGALMRYGAPSHRIEEHLRASARAIAIDAEFLYIPGAMICTFIDNTMQANSVQVVRQNSGLDFGRLKDVFGVYKCVIHNKYGADHGLEELDNIISRPDDHGDIFRIIMFGLASVVVGPFSFNTRPIDFAPIFVLGCCLGFAQIKIVPRSDQFSNVFEVFACVLIAFAARGLGSIRWPGGGEYVFCFSGVAQSAIAMILPGFMVLNSALELQSRNVVSGSVRMVYSIIYVLFLAFGLLIGTTIFGLMKRDATTEVSCAVPEWWTPGLSYRLLYTRFIWAPLFACTVAKIYKAKWKQLPIMALIATAGHQANFWISTQLSSNLQVANAIGAFVIGCIANLYSRMFHGLAAAAMLPAIYCQVPGGLAASGSLVAGIDSSNQIFGNSSTISVINNGTTGFVQAQQDPNSVYGGTIFNVGYGMVQVAIGISVGLYLSALVVYPFGKRRSGLSSF